MPTNEQLDELAQEIAKGLGEDEYLPVFRKLVRKYPEDVVRRAYERTLEIPAERVRKSRGALFNYLIKQYGRKNLDS
jgi:hypothetical protein